MTTLLEGCSAVLEGASEVLYEVLFTLAQDDWPQVSSHCQAWLTSCLPQQPQAVRHSSRPHPKLQLQSCLSLGFGLSPEVSFGLTACSLYVWCLDFF